MRVYIFTVYITSLFCMLLFKLSKLLSKFKIIIKINVKILKSNSKLLININICLRFLGTTFAAVCNKSGQIQKTVSFF